MDINSVTVQVNGWLTVAMPRLQRLEEYGEDRPVYTLALNSEEVRASLHVCAVLSTLPRRYFPLARSRLGPLSQMFLLEMLT